MTDITFGTPSWDVLKSVHVINLHTTFTSLSESQYIDISGNQYIEVSGPDMESDSLKTFIQSFVTELIKTDAQNKWFPSRLRESSILKRLSHEMTKVVAGEWILRRMDDKYEWASFEWKPTSLQISTKGFTLCWSVLGITKASPRIPLRFLPPVSRPESPIQNSSETANIRQFTIQPPTAEDELEQVADIPFTSENTADFDKQMRDKNAVQEARLRLALAKLKAERLSTNYYQKYGEELTDEEDSEEDSDDSGN
jgi:hypothetical protein